MTSDRLFERVREEVSYPLLHVPVSDMREGQRISQCFLAKQKAQPHGRFLRIHDGRWKGCKTYLFNVNIKILLPDLQHIHRMELHVMPARQPIALRSMRPGFIDSDLADLSKMKPGKRAFQ